MALDPIQQSPFIYYPQVIDAGGGISKSFNEGYGSAQAQETNRIAMDTAQQAQRTNDQMMRLRDAEERRKQLQFEQSQGDRANSLAAFAALAKGGGAPQTAAPSLNFNPFIMQPAVPQAGPSAVGGGNEFPAPTAPQAPAPRATNTTVPTPGTQAAYEPSSEKPAWYNPQPRTVGLTGPQYAQNTRTANDASPEPWQGTPLPYMTVDPNLPAVQSRSQAAIREREVATDVGNIARDVASGQYLGVPLRRLNGEENQFTEAQLTQREGVRAETQKIVDFYSNPQVQEYLKSNPALAYSVSRNPVAFYQQNATTLTANPATAPAPTPSTSTQPIVVSGADGKPVSINVSPGNSDPNMLGANTLAGVGLNRGMTQAPIVLTPAAVNTEVQKITESQNPAVFKLAAFDERVRKAQSDTEYYARMRDFAARTRNAQVYFEADKNLRALQYESSVIGQERAVISFNMGDTAPLARQIAEIGARNGFQIQLQQNQDGTFDVFESGKKVNSAVSRKDLADTAASMFDFTRKQQEAAMTALNAELYKYARTKGIDANYEILKKQSELAGETTRDTTRILNQLNADVLKKMQEQGYKAQEQDIQIQLDANNPSIAYIHDKKNVNKIGVVNLEDEKDPTGKKTGRKLLGTIDWRTR
jgi:hypothetical protein